MLREHAAHNVFVDVDAEGISDLLGDARTPNLGLRRFISTMAAMSSAEGPLGPSVRRGEEEDVKSRRYFRQTEAL